MDTKAILMTVIGVAVGIILASVVKTQLGMSNYESDSILS